MSSEQLVRIEHLHRDYGQIHAVNDVSYEIARGDVLGFLGPNGAGKSTTMQMITGNLAPSGGEIRVCGIDLLDQPKRAKSEIGYLPEQPPVYPDLTVDEYLAYCARLHRVSKGQRDRAIDRAKQRCGLGDVGRRLIGNLSKGYRQRVGIAQAILHNPAVVILDEPTVGLDPRERIRFRNLMSDLSTQDRIILLSTHIVGDISSTCETIALMDLGRVIFHGAPSDLVDSARGKVWSITTGYEDLDSWKVRFPVISTVPSEGGYELRIVAEDPDTAEAVPAEPNLEDAYIHYMQKAASGRLSGAFE